MITHIVLLQPKISTSIEQVTAFLEHLQAHHSHPAHLAVMAELDRICQQSIDFDLPETVQ